MKKRERMTRSGAGAATLPRCKLFDQLLFIKDTVLNRPSISNIVTDDYPQQSDVDLFTPPQSPSYEQLVRSPQVESFQPHTKRSSTSSENKRKKIPKQLDVGDQILLDALNNSSKKEATLDADVSFAESIVPILRSLPARKNRQAKIEIQQILMRHEFDE